MKKSRYTESLIIRVLKEVILIGRLKNCVIKGEIDI